MNGCGTAPGSAGGTEAPWAVEEAWVGATLEKPTGTRLPSLSVSTTWSSEIDSTRYLPGSSAPLAASTSYPPGNKNVAVILPPAP